MPKSEREIRESLQESGYSFNPETDYDDFAENREGGPRDAITSLVIEAIHAENERIKNRYIEPKAAEDEVRDS